MLLITEIVKKWMFNSNSSEHFLHKNITKTWNPHYPSATGLRRSEFGGSPLPHPKQDLFILIKVDGSWRNRKKAVSLNQSYLLSIFYFRHMMYASLMHVRKLRSFVYYIEICPVEVIIQGLWFRFNIGRCAGGIYHTYVCLSVVKLFYLN